MKKSTSAVLGMVLAASATPAAAQTPPAAPPIVINQGLMRLTQQLGVAYTQTRLSYTAPPFPVQFVNTSPLVAAVQPRASYSPSLVSGASPTTISATPVTTYITSQVALLPAGTYTATANQTQVSLVGTVNNEPVARTIAVPNQAVPYLPGNPVSGTVSVNSVRTGGPVVVNYTYTPTR